MSQILLSTLTAAGGLLAGLSLAGTLLRRQRQTLNGLRNRQRSQHDELLQTRYQVTHDDTTNMPNRRAFLAHLRAALRASHHVGVILLDLDDFTSINDTYGHEHGNDVLTAIGQRLIDLPPPVVLAARLSGNDFALLVHGDHDTTADTALAGWTAVRRHPVRLGTDLIEVRASVGYVTARCGSTTRQLLRDADEAMYHAKTTGDAVSDAAPVPADSAQRRPRDRRARRREQTSDS